MRFILPILLLFSYSSFGQYGTSYNSESEYRNYTVSAREHLKLFGGKKDSTASFLYLQPGRVNLYGDSMYNGGAYLQLGADSALLYNRRHDNPNASYLELIGSVAGLYGGGISTGGYLSLQPGSFALTDRTQIMISTDAFNAPNVLNIDAPIIRFNKYAAPSGQTESLYVDDSGYVVKASGGATSGAIISNIYGQITDGIIYSFTTPNDSVHYTISGNLNITYISSNVIQYCVHFTDINNNTQTLTAIAGLSSTGYYNVTPLDVFAAPNTTVTIETVLTTSYGNIRFDASAVIKKEN